MPQSTKPKPFAAFKASTNAPVPDSFKAEGDRVKRRAEAAKAAEAAAAETTPELITDPITREVREAPAVEPAKPEAAGWGDWKVADEVPPHKKLEEDVAVAVAAIKAQDAEVARAEAVRKAPEVERARLAAEKAKAEEAKRAEREAKDEEVRREVAAKATVAIELAQAEALQVTEPRDPTVADHIRDALAEGAIGTLTVGHGQLGPILEELTGTGGFSREGHQARAGVVSIDRDAGALAVRVQLPARNGTFARLAPHVGADLDQAGPLRWLKDQIESVTDTPATEFLPLLVVVGAEAVPQELAGLRVLVSHATDVCVALVADGETPGWQAL